MHVSVSRKMVRLIVAGAAAAALVAAAAPVAAAPTKHPNTPNAAAVAKQWLLGITYRWAP